MKGSKIIGSGLMSGYSLLAVKHLTTFSDQWYFPQNPAGSSIEAKRRLSQSDIEMELVALATYILESWTCELKIK